MLTSKLILPCPRPPRLQVIATLVAALGAPGCGADGAELAGSDAVALGSLEQAFRESTCASTTADAILPRDAVYITPAGYDHPECRGSAVLDAPELVVEDDVVYVSWVDTTPVDEEKACSRQRLGVSLLAATPVFPERRNEIAFAESRGEWVDRTCVMAPLRLDPCDALGDCLRILNARIVVSGTTAPIRKGSIKTRMVSVSYGL